MLFRSMGNYFVQYDPKLANKLLDEMGMDKRDSDGFRIGPNGKTYSEWNKWVGDLALAGLKERSLEEEKFFDSFFEIVMEKAPLGCRLNSIMINIHKLIFILNIISI